MLMPRLAPSILTMQGNENAVSYQSARQYGGLHEDNRNGDHPRHTGHIDGTGRITFSGAIVEDACRVNQQEKQMQVTCLSGPSQTTETVDLQQLAREASMSLSHSQVSYQWVDEGRTDEGRTMAIVTISHK